MYNFNVLGVCAAYKLANRPYIERERETERKEGGSKDFLKRNTNDFNTLGVSASYFGREMYRWQTQAKTASSCTTPKLLALMILVRAH